MSGYSRDLDAYITNRAVELNQEKSESEIAEIISNETGEDISRNVVHGRLYRLKARNKLSDKPLEFMPYFEKYREILEGRKPSPKKVDYDFSEGFLKILVINDLHIPFQYDESIEFALESNMSADIVVTSEVSDLYSLTRFSKTKHASFELEVEGILRWYEFLNENFPVSYVILAGHDKRLPKYVLSRIKSELLFLFEPYLVEALAKPFERVIFIDRVYHQINDALFTHLNKHSTVIPMRSADSSHKWIQNWKKHLNIDEYRLLVQAHSHHSGLINLPNVQLVETGCNQRVPEWIFDKNPMLPWVHGHTVVYQKNGVTDLNSTEVKVYRG